MFFKKKFKQIEEDFLALKRQQDLRFKAERENTFSLHKTMDDKYFDQFSFITKQFADRDSLHEDFEKGVVSDLLSHNERITDLLKSNEELKNLVASLERKLNVVANYSTNPNACKKTMEKV